MMKEVCKQNFELINFGIGSIVSDIYFEKCKFNNCFFSSRVLSGSPPAEIKNSVFKNCRIEGCEIGSGILQDVQIENLAIKGLLSCFGIRFSNVVLKGKIGRILISKIMDRAADFTAIRS